MPDAEAAKKLDPLIWYDRDDDPLRPMASQIRPPERPVVGVGDGTEPRPHADTHRPQITSPRFTLEAEQAAAKLTTDEMDKVAFMLGYDRALQEIAEREAILAAQEAEKSDTTSTSPSATSTTPEQSVGDIDEPDAPSREPEGEPEGTPPAPPDPTPAAEPKAGKATGTPARE